MKVLFAVNDEKDAESITRMYQKEFKEIITSKTVYYYNAIIKELQKDKSYDRIVISEDLEMFSSNNYQAVDKFVFEKMDAISDEATNNEGGDIPIILLAMDRRTKNDPLLVKLFGLGIYNVLLGKDRSVQKVAELINKPRSKKEAKAYYRVETEKVSYSSDEDNNGVSESEMQSILNHYKRIGGNIPKCVRSFDSIISQYSEEQAKLIAKSLPKSVTEILEDNSDSYRKLLGIEGQRFPGIGAKKDNDYVEKEIETSSKLKQPVIIPTAVSSKKINRVRSAEEIRRAKLRLEKEKAQEEAQKREEERIEREKAEMARKKREQLLKERAEAEAKRKAEVEAKRKEREKILKERAKAEARRKEEERIAREKAEAEARRKEEERIAREKAEEARRRKEERIAKEKAREEARRKEEERIAREKAEEEERRKEEEKMAREKAETEAKKKEERKIKAKTVATKSTKEENNDDEIVTTKRRRGRPRKNPVIEEVDENNELEDVPVKRRRGRPRKNPIIVENEKEDEVVSNRKNTTTKESDNNQNKNNDDIDKDNDLDEFDNLNYNDDEINDDKYYNDKYDDESDIYDDDDFDYDDYDFDDLDDDYKSEDLEEDYNDNKDSKLSEFDDYDDKDLDDTSDYEDEDEENDDTLPGFEDYDDEDSEDTLDYEDEDSKDSKDTLDYEDEDEEDDDTLPGFEDYDDEESEDSKDTLDYEDEDEEDDDTLPGFEDYDDEESEDSKDTLDYEDEDEEDDDTLPGFEDYDDEDSEDSKDTLDYEDEDEEDDDTLPGFDDYDDEESEDSKDTLDYEDEEDDDPLPGFDEDEDDNDFKDTENDYKEENDDDIDDMFDYDDDEDNKEEEKEENQTQHNGTFKGINNRNYRYDNNLADSIKDLKETEETQEYNVDTDNLITSNQKIISFVGTSKNGTSFIVNNLAELFSNKGINTAILDLTKNKNSYYVYTNNENELKEKAQTCLDKLKQGIADGVQVNKNLTVYTSLPNEDDSLDEVTAIIHTLLENYSIVLLDCDFDTDVRYFKVAQEIYLVQSLDVLTIQPLTAFLRDLKVKNILDTSKLRIIINKNIKMKLLNERNLIAGMSSYNDPAMTYMTELFDENTIKFITIPFEDQVYVKYLESLVNCNINLKGYSKNFMSSLNKLADMVYPTINGKKAKENYNNFSKNTNSILDKMKKKY